MTDDATRGIPPLRAPPPACERSTAPARSEVPLPPAAPAGVEPPDDAQTLVGQVVADRYLVQDLLGAGGMGRVYRAEHVHMRKVVALKVLHQTLTHLPEVVARFEREAVAAAKIEHPNIAAATDFGRLADGSFYLVLEYVEGKSLAERLREDGALPPPRAVRIAREIALALDAAHQAQVVHRDLKPDNVMLIQRDGQEQVKVLDFGIAKVIGQDTENRPALTRLGDVFGTPEYMSPEQALGQPVDQRSDLYALGIVLFEMLAGRSPFEGGDPISVLTRQITAAPPPLPGVVSPKLGALVTGLLQKSPDDRVSDARSVAAELSALELESAAPAGLHPGFGVHDGSADPKRRRELLVQLEASGRVLLGGVRALLASSTPFLRSRVALGRILLPWWGLLLIVSGLLGAVLVSWPDRSDGSGTPEAASSSAELGPAPASGTPIVVPGQESQDAHLRRQLEQLERLPVYKRSAEHWVRLAQIHGALHQHLPAVSAYRNAMSKRPSLAKDAGVLRDLRRAGATEEAHEEVIHLCESRLMLGRRGLLGSGPDLLYQLWLDTRDVPEKAHIADRLLRKLVVLSGRTSSSLRVAVELGSLTSCAKLEGTLARARKHADARSLDALNALAEKTSCQGSAPQCYACLAGNPDLEAALSRARQQPGPRLFDRAVPDTVSVGR